MSLINEALKKAQRQRSLDSAPLSSAPSGVAAAAVTTHVRAASHRRSHAPVWFGLGLLVLGAGATGLIMRYGFTPAAPVPVTAAPVAPTGPVPAPTPVVATPAPAPVATVPLVTLPPIVPVPPPATPAPAVPAPAPTAMAPAPVPAPTAVAPLPPTPAPAPVAVAPVAAPLTAAEREAAIYAFLNTARLTGVRGLDAQARVLMNEKVFRLNDLVEPLLGLRLSAVRPGLMVFTDPQGKTYEKPY